MNNWLVTLINTCSPFEKKEVVVHAETIIEALDEKIHKHPTYYARSARYHSNVDPMIYNEKFVDIV